MADQRSSSRSERRRFLKNSAALGLSAGIAALGAEQAANAQTPQRWDRSADVVIAGAGASGLCAAIAARDLGASVIAIDENHDVGGHALVSGGRVPLGGGTSWQRRYGVEDSPDLVFLDHTNHSNPEFVYGDRELIRAWADENVPTFEFLLENGVEFVDAAPTVVNGGSVPRLFVCRVYSDDLNETIAGNPGSGLVRPLEASARRKGVEFLLAHGLDALVRDHATGRVLGISARSGDRILHIRALKGVVVATGGHTSNVEFRRIFDPRLTEEYQVAGEPWSRPSAAGEIAAMGLGASLWATANQNRQAGLGPITKTRHIGCRFGYQHLKWDPKSPVFARARASGLTVSSFQNVILVNQVGRRFWNEMDESFDFLNACLGTNGNLGKGPKQNGGGPIWAIFDADAVARERWRPEPPHVDPTGFFFAADTLAELAARIESPYQPQPIPAAALEATVARYNAFVAKGKDEDFGKPAPRHRIGTPPFYAAWSTPILHDSLTGLRIDTQCRVIDTHGRVIPSLFCCGECAGGFALHGLPRVTVFGRMAGRAAARAEA